MATKTTVAIEDRIRKIIRKIAVLLDISQGEVIDRAIQEYEKKVISEKKRDKKMSKAQSNDIDKILKKATEEIYAKDPEFKEMHEKLYCGPETIDDFIIDEWDSGLEE